LTVTTAAREAIGGSLAANIPPVISPLRASNYTITQNTATNGLTVNPVPLTITASSPGMI
jgi:hypothetical protein